MWDANDLEDMGLASCVLNRKAMRLLLSAISLVLALLRPAGVRAGEVEDKTAVVDVKERTGELELRMRATAVD